MDKGLERNAHPGRADTISACARPDFFGPGVPPPQVAAVPCSFPPSLLRISRELLSGSARD
eukprot:2954419-Lingulodinium_polyedra.AAC.1